MFKQRLHSSGIIDLSVIPPCRSVLALHLRRAAFTAFNWKQAKQRMGTDNDIQSNGWYADGEIVWTEEVYPIDIQDIFEDTTEYSDIEEEVDDDADDDTECEESDEEL